MSDESISQGLLQSASTRSSSVPPSTATARPVDLSMAEADVRIDSPVPDWCNLGLTLRIVVAVNVLFLCVAAVDRPTPGLWLDQWLRLAMVVEPVLLASLLGGCLVRRLTWRLPHRGQIAIALLLPGALLLVAERAMPATIASANPLRDACFAVMLAGAILYWSRLRDLAHSPALAEAQLQALQSRIRPHFLFNSLNAALGLIRSDPRRAETVLEDISDLFRVLMRDSRERVPLDNEVALCKQYLAIEKLRLGDRLRTEWRIDDNALQALVPTLLLQPLIENAVHHGIEPSATGGTIAIDVVRAGRNVDITIANPWQGEALAERTRGNRIGLDNVRQRLALVHDIEASIDSSVRDGRYVVRVRMPAERRRAPRAGKIT